MMWVEGGVGVVVFEVAMMMMMEIQGFVVRERDYKGDRLQTR